MLEIIPIKAFSDNYLWLFKQADSKHACIVDPGDAAPVLDYLRQHDLSLSSILLTHHHQDHIGGVDELLRHFKVPVYGPDSAKIPQVTAKMYEGDKITLCDVTFSVLEIPGHTMDHIAYFSDAALYQNSPILFCGDTLFAGGCGRVFEGTHEMMHASLQKLADLPANTLFFCAHEYTLSNLKFAQALNPDDFTLMARVREEQAKRLADKATVPSSIALELKTNPFLRCHDEDVISAAQHYAGQKLSSPQEVFGVIREWKNIF